jgi:hypothetical protein
MRRTVLQIAFLIWLGSYLAGPLFQTFDVWDTPQEEMGDVASSQCGSLIWAGCAVGLAIFALRQLLKSCRSSIRQNLVDPLLQPSEILFDPSSNGSGFKLVGSPPLRI